MISINTNLSSLVAQNSMKSATNKLNTAIERMSTGFKINHAKDNAANYSISTNMSTKIGAYNVAEDNTAMGLDMLTTASESLSLIEDKLTRLRDLSIQASNGTYGTQSMQAINSEANALIDEIERIYNNSEYNGINLSKGRVVNSEESKFLKDIDRRDTSNMTKLASVAIDEKLESGTYSISTADELAKLATMTNNGLIGTNTEFVLANDIDIRHITNWTPIGKLVKLDDGSVNYEFAFQSSFDGNGYVINGLNLNTTENYSGLFGFTYCANIEDVGLKNAVISSSGNYSSSFIGNAHYTNIKNCYANVDINVINNEVIAGLVGMGVSVSMNSCYTTGNVVAKKTVGGLCGVLNGASNIKNCYSSVNIEGRSVLGGLVASSYDYCSFENCYSTGDVVSTSTTLTAGNLIGQLYVQRTPEQVPTNITLTNAIIVENCYASGNVTNGGNPTGLVGRVSNSKDVPYILKFENCNYNTDEIIGSDISTVTEIVFNNTNKIDANTQLFAFENNAKCTNYSTETRLQVGINNTDESAILFSLGDFVLSNLSSFRLLGTKKTNFVDFVDKIDSVLKIVSNKQTEYGAVQNRLESVLEEITIQRDNLVSSRSTICDADISEVSSTYIQQQILQQASATLLATANQTPSIALQLI